MICVAFLHHNPGGYVGGAELTMQEFAAQAPKDVEVVWGNGDADRYVIGNWQAERPSGFRYVHDMRGGFLPDDELIFCSPLQRRQYGMDGHVIPPALNLSAFRPSRQHRRNGKRKGAVSINSWQNPGKGQQLLKEWAEANGPVDVYGEGIFAPSGGPLDYKGPLDPAAVPQTLWDYETFVHLPTALEPFGRTVVEAHAAGCKVITNDLVGARHFIERDPLALEGAAEDFWNLIVPAPVLDSGRGK